MAFRQVSNALFSSQGSLGVLPVLLSIGSLVAWLLISMAVRTSNTTARYTTPSTSINPTLTSTSLATGVLSQWQLRRAPSPRAQHPSLLRQPPRRLAPMRIHVPSDSFGGLSPERKASEALRRLLTFAACRIILAQLEGSGRGDLASYNRVDPSLGRDWRGYGVLESHCWVSRSSTRL